MVWLPKPEPASPKWRLRICSPKSVSAKFSVVPLPAEKNVLVGSRSAHTASWKLPPASTSSAAFRSPMLELLLRLPAKAPAHASAFGSGRVSSHPEPTMVKAANDGEAAESASEAKRIRRGILMLQSLLHHGSAVPPNTATRAIRLHERYR